MLPRVLLTAFEPFGPFPQNASLTCLEEVLRQPLPACELQTRIYPVDFEQVEALLAADLQWRPDFVLHLGQSSHASAVQLEMRGRNVRYDRFAQPDAPIRPLRPTGPAECFSPLPLAEWAERLRGLGLPAVTSEDAGQYLCNAALYWSLLQGQNAAFIHLPLLPGQLPPPIPPAQSLPATVTAQAVLHILSWALAEGTEVV